MSETPQSPEKKGFAITSLEQLKAEYPIFNIWPITDDQDEIKKRQEEAEIKATDLINKNGGLTADECHMLNHYKEGEDIHNDI
ncbi:MAG: hypothetical protein ABII72_04245 [Parcubacteria group bacterium]